MGPGAMVWRPCPCASSPSPPPSPSSAPPVPGATAARCRRTRRGPRPRPSPTPPAPAPPGEPPGGADQFGRLLGYAYADGSQVNLALVEGGYALALQTDHPRLAEFLAAEDAGYAAGAGLWAADACGPPFPAVLGLVDLEPDPPGPDADNLNGEWVLLAHAGAEAAHLTGWVLRDAAS